MSLSKGPGLTSKYIGSNIWYGSTTPSAKKVGELWIDVSSTPVLKIANAVGTGSWAAVEGGAGSFTDLSVTETLALTGILSPSQITGNQNDYAPTGHADATIFRLSTDASRNITSLAGGASGRIVIIENVGSNAIVLTDDDGATGTAANRFALAGNVTLYADQCAVLRYDATTSRWRMIAGPPAGAHNSLGTQTIFIPADSMRPRTTGGCAAVAVEETATNKVCTPYLAFDGTTEEYAQFRVWMPKGWDEGTVTFQPCWAPASGSGDVIWGLQAVAGSNDDARDTAFGTAQTSTDTVIAVGDFHIGPVSSAITIAGTPAEGDWVTFQVYRDADAAGDTLNGVDAWLFGIKLNITLAAANDG